MVSGGGRLRPQEDTLNNPIDMVVGTPGRVLQHIEEGNIVYGDIKYVVSIMYINSWHFIYTIAQFYIILDVCTIYCMFLSKFRIKKTAKSSLSLLVRWCI